MSTQKVQELVLNLAGPRDGSPRPMPLSDKIDGLVSTSNQEHTNVYPDEVAALGAVCKVIDSEADGDRAWSMVSDIELTGVFTQPREVDHMMRAAGHSILRSTVAYVNEEGKCASGVLIDIDGRYFLATTAHL